MFKNELNRRRVLIGSGALAVGTVGSIAAASNNVSATVDGEFEIPDGETILADTTLQDVRLSVYASWAYEANARMHAVELELHVGQSEDTMDLISRFEDDEIGTDELSGEETLAGSLMSASDFSIEDFDPDGGELNRTVMAELRLYVLRNESVEGEAVKQTTFDVVVKDEKLEVSTSLGGEGEVTFDRS